MEALVLKMKNWSHLSLILFLVAAFAVAPLKAHAQDDMSPGSDEETIIPPNTGANQPPVNIDESDSNAVTDVEEYDG